MIKKDSPTRRNTLRSHLLGSLLLVSIFCPHLLTAQNDLPSRPTSRAGDPTVYQVQQGDTPESIALATLGGKEFAQELLRYNRIDDPTAVRSGMSLVIPGRERDAALSGLWQAKDKRDLATAADAEKYAPELLRQADILFNAASQAFQSADYGRAAALATRAHAQFIRALEAADVNAVKDRMARIIKLAGNLRFSADGGVTWNNAKEGERIPVNARLRTDKGSRAEIQMPDLSVFFIDEFSEVEFTIMREDERTGKMDTLLEVSTGEIFGNIKPKKKESGSKFFIKNGRSTIVIRGTTIRTNRDQNGWLRSMTLTGVTEVQTDGEKTVPVNGGFGVYAPPGSDISDPVALLDAPTPIFPDSNVEQTTQQVINFSWKKISSFKLKNYKIEIARDTKFVEMVHTATTKETELESPPLEQGEYYWRISSMDKKGLQGAYSEPVKFLIETNYELTLVADKAPIQKDGLIWLPPGTTITAEPVDAENTSVTKVAYSVNNSEYKVYPRGITLKTDAEYQVSVIGEGATGQKGKTFNRIYRVDGTGPTIDFKLGEISTDPVLGKIRPLKITATDESDIRQILVSVNKGELTRYTGAISLTISDEHEINVTTTDVFGNESRRRTIIDRLPLREKSPSFEPAR